MRQNRHFFCVAVILFELDECLTVAGMGGLQTTFFPQPDDVVVFRFKLLQQVAGTFGEPFLAFVLAVGIEEGNHGIDNQQVDGGVAEGFRTGGRGFAENVVGKPVKGGTSTQQVVQFFHRRGQQQLREHALGTVVEVGQLGDAYVRKVARAHAELFHRRCSEGCSSNL
mgnify:CR=1 FL=1